MSKFIEVFDAEKGTEIQLNSDSMVTLRGHYKDSEAGHQVSGTLVTLLAGDPIFVKGTPKSILKKISNSRTIR